MRYFYYLFFSSVVLLSSCAPDDSAFEMEDVWICKTKDFSGYLVPNGSQNEGTLYVDEGNLYAKEYSVIIKELFGQTYIKSDDFSYTRCQLTPYVNPAYRDCPEGADYLSPQFKVKAPFEVVYGNATGFWTSYPNVPENNFGEIFIQKVPIKYFLGRYPQDLTLDVYEPDDGEKHSRPLVIMIHGGGFYNGDKADIEYKYWCKRFAQCGYTAVSVNYRLGFGLLFPIEKAAYCALQDVNASIRYLLAHRDKFKVNPEFIYLAGCSAGAITALNTAFLNDSILPVSLAKEVSDLGPITAVNVTPECEIPFTIRAVGNMWGAVMDTTILKSSPTSIISFHDKFDPIVPYEIGVPFEKSVTDYLREQTNDIISKYGGIVPFVRSITDPAIDMISELGRSVTKKILPPVYGSYCIDSMSHRIGKRTKLFSFDRKTHTLIRDKDYSLNDLLDSIFIEMSSFFANEMNIHQIEIRQDENDERIVYIDDPTYVNDCSWSIVGGFITEAVTPTKIRVLLIRSSPEHVIKVNGIKDTGMTFEDSIVL